MGERPAEEPAAPASSPAADGGVTLDVILLALRVLGQRTAAIAMHAYPVLALTAAFYMWLRVMDNPSVLQLVGLGVFGIFLLSMQVLRGRK